MKRTASDKIEFKMSTLTSGSFFRFRDVKILPTIDTSSQHFGRDQALYCGKSAPFYCIGPTGRLREASNSSHSYLTHLVPMGDAEC